MTTPGHKSGTRASSASPEAQGNWRPAYEPWRHGGWYVTNIRYPGGAVGCVSRNYPDRKWRIVGDCRPGAHEEYTFRTRDDAARTERKLVASRWERIGALAPGLAPVTGAGTAPNTTDTSCAVCDRALKAGKGLNVPGIGGPAAVLDNACSEAIGREQDDPGGARWAPAGYARNAGPAQQGSLREPTAESFPAPISPSQVGAGHSTGFPPTLHPAVPEAGDSRAQKPARRHPGQPVPPRTQGRGQ